jgi:hypothetical protein
LLLSHGRDCRDCRSPHEITEGKASSLAFMGDIPQQNLAETNGLDDFEFVILVFH